MKVHQGIYFPDGETHLPDWMDKAGEIVDGKGTYQIAKLRTAVAQCRQKRVAIDVGGHVGLWSMQLAKQFQFVHAFEPVKNHRDCFELNVFSSNVILHPCALGEVVGSCSIHTAPTSSGDSWVKGDGDIPVQRLDDFELTDVDFIKIDTEGFELFVLRGGEQTLRRWMPVVIVEQKPGHAQRFGIGERDAIPYLESLGYKKAKEISGDFIMVPA